MRNTSDRDELLKHLNLLMVDPKLGEALQEMSVAQLRIIAETLDDLAKWNPNRRGEVRKSLTRRVQVSPAEGNAFKNQVGLQEDISTNGAGILVNRPIPVGTRIKVQFNGQESLGTVRRCQQDRSGWIIGVLYDQGSKSGEATRPASDSAPGSQLEPPPA